MYCAFKRVHSYSFFRVHRFSLISIENTREINKTCANKESGNVFSTPCTYLVKVQAVTRGNMTSAGRKWRGSANYSPEKVRLLQGVHLILCFFLEMLLFFWTLPDLLLVIALPSGGPTAARRGGVETLLPRVWLIYLMSLIDNKSINTLVV